MGKQVSESAVVRFSVTIPKAYADRLDKLAAQDFTSRNHQILAAIRAHLDADKQRRQSK